MAADNEVIQLTLNLLRARLSAVDADLITQLADRYFSNISSEELSKRTSEELYMLILHHWELMNSRQPGESKIAVHTPKQLLMEKSSQHTIVQVSVDNMPFLVDSLQMALHRLGYTIYLMFHFGGMKIRRDKSHRIKEIYAFDSTETSAESEAPITIEIDAVTDEAEKQIIIDRLQSVLNDLKHVVTDWPDMRKRMQESIIAIDDQTKHFTQSEIDESKSFLQWLLDNHFTFLGCRDYFVKTKVIKHKKELVQELVSGTGLGVLKDESRSKKIRCYSDLPNMARELAVSNKSLLIVSKTNTMATIHRDTYSDYIGIKYFNDDGELYFERRVIGLFTSSAYSSDPKTIPILREKVKGVLAKSALPTNSHSGKDLYYILATLPRDDLFHSNIQELYQLSMGILRMQNRRQIRLFTHHDAYGRYVSCLVYFPKENFNTDVTKKIQHILLKAYDGEQIGFDISFSGSVLCRVHYVIRIDSTKKIHVNVKEIEQQLCDVAESWMDVLKRALTDYFGEEKGNLLTKRYNFAFQAGFREAFTPRHTVFDIEQIERLTNTDDLEMSFYRPLNASPDLLCFKLYHLETTIPLSDALPMLENMGLRVIGEQPYQITLNDRTKVWVNDFEMTYAHGENIDLEESKYIFQEAFRQIWRCQATNDPLNQLILKAKLNWKEINILRAVMSYALQCKIAFSRGSIVQALVAQSDITRQLIQLFHARFDPGNGTSALASHDDLIEKIMAAFEQVVSRDEDRILKVFLSVILAIVRTNYYQENVTSDDVYYLSFKIHSSDLSIVPLPKPKYEIYVYSAQFEGIHLRAGKRARGGIRWSDRQDDFRSEVLGLMKAQVVKNSVIVPTGAKGGFILKQPLSHLSREAIYELGVKAYKGFIRGLLSLTDNLHKNIIIPPSNTVRHDDDDPYLVVAADKGTATFSTIANSVAVTEYDFWLGDAFASGDVTGYDHKKMGITARGAVLSAIYHFNSLNKDISQETFTMIGIGDMSGDVFGNGLLMLKNAKLQAAFNHLHIFIDPNPNVDKSYLERQRLFNLPRSTWSDYDQKCISSGGGVFSRAAKLIKLTDEIKQWLDVSMDTIEPNHLIRLLLKTPVDLLWNGGIGTYVKAADETDAEVGDRNNDSVRINGSELGAKIVAEGGNLGVTQLGRIEAAINGCLLNTDFIDNSAGVDCSDHEVNIKILLRHIERAGDLTFKQRNELLSSMTEDVGILVLKHNYQQNKQLSLASFNGENYLNLYDRYLDKLELNGVLSRSLEFLPDNADIQVRRANKQALTRPELSVIMSYTKIDLKKALLDSSFFTDPFLLDYLYKSFPTILKKRYASALLHHPLRDEIIATEFCHRMVTNAGISFCYQLQDETGAALTKIASSYEAVKHIFQIRVHHKNIKQLDKSVPHSVQIKMYTKVSSLIRRTSRWLVRNNCDLSIQETVERYATHANKLITRLPKLLLGSTKDEMLEQRDQLMEVNVPERTATMIACFGSAYHALNIIEAAILQDAELFRVAKIYFILVERFELLWFREQIDAVISDTRWAILAKSSMKSDLDLIQRKLTNSVLHFKTNAKSIPGRIKAWEKEITDHIARWKLIVQDLRTSDSATDFTILMVAVNQLGEIAKVSHANYKEH